MLRQKQQFIINLELINFRLLSFFVAINGFLVQCSQLIKIEVGIKLKFQLS